MIIIDQRTIAQMQPGCKTRSLAVEAFAMHLPLDPSSTTPNRGPRVPLSVGPLFEREGGQVVRADVLAIADGIVTPRPFWELLQGLAARAEWLRAYDTTTTRSLSGNRVTPGSPSFGRAHAERAES